MAKVGVLPTLALYRTLTRSRQSGSILMDDIRGSGPGSFSIAEMETELPRLLDVLKAIKPQELEMGANTVQRYGQVRVNHPSCLISPPLARVSSSDNGMISTPPQTAVTDQFIV